MGICGFVPLEDLYFGAKCTNLEHFYFNFLGFTDIFLKMSSNLISNALHSMWSGKFQHPPPPIWDPHQPQVLIVFIGCLLGFCERLYRVVRRYKAATFAFGLRLNTKL